MNKTEHIEGGGTIRKVLQEAKPKDVHHDSVKEAIDFYINDPSYAEVYIVRCSNCRNDMCLEVLEPQAVAYHLSIHHQGRRRITLGDNEYPTGRLLSHRKRLDGVMGYRCVCGNTTILSQPEQGLIPQTTDPNEIPYLPILEPHQAARLHLEMANTGYTPDVETIGNTTRIESFTVERLK